LSLLISILAEKRSFRFLAIVNKLESSLGIFSFITIPCSIQYSKAKKDRVRNDNTRTKGILYYTAKENWSSCCCWLIDNFIVFFFLKKTCYSYSSLPAWRWEKS
jgi:hypothetical protein